MEKKNNISWQLEDFIDSLVFELDKARETLSVKGVNNPLTYAVKDLSMDLNVFPEYNGNDVRFVTAGSGQEGASKISLSLGSITDRQIRETARKPISEDDVTLDEIKEIDSGTKQQLNRLGIRSADDIKKYKERKIKVHKPTGGKVGAQPIDFKKLAGLINKAQRTKKPPRVFAAEMGVIRGRKILAIKGENFSLENNAKIKATLNTENAKVLGVTKDHIVIELSSQDMKSSNDLNVQLDENTAFNLRINVNKENERKNSK
ncbi:MAG: hypothetical protein MK066_13425 [Crocinitomicaceae bacterium]|nr:hypothetical protein [Crocinitomicaceae bacterium]